MTKVVLVGACGRMGRILARCLLGGAEPGLELAGAVDLWDAPEQGADIGPLAGSAPCGVRVTADLAAVAPAADVVIDFSGHHGAAGNAARCAEWGKALVIGTTGLDPEETEAVRGAAKAVPVVFAPNMSRGISLLLSLVEQAARALKGQGYDVELIERHHRRKKDAPSGTALALGEAAARGSGWSLERVAQHGRSGLAAGDRPEEQIGFHAVRGGDFVGDHTVLFAAEGECLEFTHRATSRDTFARGALRAAVWAAGRAPGLYGMRDVLGLG